MSQQYSLRWNNHQPNFISMFTNLLNTQTLVDVTLAADGKHLQAHKVVLSACSSYFQALFVDNPSQHPIVILKDVSFADLRTMVDFMYYGEVNVTEEQLPQVLDTAKHLKIKGLTEMPDSTSLTRSQGGDLQSSIESESQRLSASPPASPTHKRRKRRKSSTGSTCLNMVEERCDAGNQTGDMQRSDTITLSSVVRRRDMHTDSMNAHQAADQHNMSVEQMGMDANAGSLSQGGQWSMMEHTYPRYPSACLGAGLGAGLGGLGGDGMYGMAHGAAHAPHDAAELEFRAPLNATGAGPSPGPSCLPEQLPGDPQQATPKRRRTTNPQSDEKFQRALEAVRFGGIGFCKAAKMFGVNNRTLWLEYKKKGYPNNRPSIRNRIKREHASPPPEHKEELAPQEQQMALLCPPHSVPAFIDSRPVDFPLQSMTHNSPLNILGVNFNSMQ